MFQRLFALACVVSTVATGAQSTSHFNIHKDNDDNDDKSNAYHVPSFTVSSLLQEDDQKRLKDVLKRSGILAIAASNEEDYKVTSQRALNGLCSCKYDSTYSDFMSHNLMADGVQRTTIGTATLGGWTHPLPLSDSISNICNNNNNNDDDDEEIKESMEHLRDLVVHVSQNFVQAVDHILLSEKHDTKKEKNVLLEDVHGTSYTSLNGIITSSTSLEHFHLYSNKPSSTLDDEHEEAEYDEEDTIATHTDAGLFLSFVPAQSCTSSSYSSHSSKEEDDGAFYVEVDGVLRQAVFPPNSVIIMVGSGMQHWLQHDNHKDDGEIFRATRHAVKMNRKSGSSRAWYGMMHLVPPDAIIQRYPTIQTFNDMRSSMSLSSRRKTSSNFDDDDHISIGCGNHHHDNNNNNNGITQPIEQQRRRRLQHVAGPESCNNVTQFMCWLICSDIPDHENAVSRLRDGQSLYCLDPSIYAKSGGSVSKATKPCTNEQNGQMGGIMNEACTGAWLPSSAVVDGYLLERNGVNIAELTDAEKQQVEEHYCHGATSMYMDGFNWKGTVCVVYLFQSWVLTSQGKFVAACFGTLFVGVLLEYILLSRRTLIPRVSLGWKRLMASTFLYGTQMALGYFVMLVVMTYSAPLFLCAILGLMVGHVCTNYKKLLCGSSSAEGVMEEEECNCGDGLTPCCQYDVGAEEGTKNTKDTSSSKGSTDEELFRDEEAKPSCCSGIDVSNI